MTPKPFKSDPKSKAHLLATAADLIVAAMANIEEAKPCAKNWADFETMAYFAGELQEFMSSDHGETGFLRYLDNAAAEATVDRTRFPVVRADGRIVMATVPPN